MQDVSIRPCIDGLAHELVCYEWGKPVVDPAAKVALYKKVIICKRCSRTADSIRKNRNGKVGRNAATDA